MDFYDWSYIVVVIIQELNSYAFYCILRQNSECFTTTVHSRTRFSSSVLKLEIRNSTFSFSFLHFIPYTIKSVS